MIIRKFAMAAIASLAFSQYAVAAVSPEEAARLGQDLTLFGAEKAGNADGTIPPYTGGLAPLPEYDRNKHDAYINPYADEKPLYTITAANMSEYEELLTEGVKAMFKRYPDTYQVNVYPTHRSARYLDWVLENTVKNATTVTMTGAVKGDALQGEDNGLPYPGVPFPIPQDGYEVVWNHKMSFAPAVMHHHSQGFVIDPTGGVTTLSTPNQYHIRPWYDQSRRFRNAAYDAISGWSATMTGPPQAAGLTFLNFYLATDDYGGQRVWFYTPGQRRARQAPDFSYDLPISAYGGGLVWDEIYGFVGRMDRFDFKLVGKEEKIVPYNAFHLTQERSPRTTLGKQHVEPDAMRFEVHRVWIVEATRKDGARHAYHTRRFYIDEDGWHIVALETYDDAGNLWKNGLIHSWPAYDVGGVNPVTWSFDDLLKGGYQLINVGAADRGFWNRSYMDDTEVRIPLTPRAVESMGIR